MADSILPGKKLISPVKRIRPGYDKKYLLLIKTPNSDETYWEVIEGRYEAYQYIKNNVDTIDVDQSFIISSGTKVDLNDMHCIYDFVKFVKVENDIVDEFDIDDYKLNINSSENIGVGLETAGNVFTGIAGSYDPVDE